MSIVLEDGTAVFVKVPEGQMARFEDANGRRYSLAGSGSSEVLIPLDIDPAVVAKIETRNREAEAAQARLMPQLQAARRRVAAIEQEMRDAGCFVPRARR